MNPQLIHFLFHLFNQMHFWNKICEKRNLVQLDTNADFFMRQHVILATTVLSLFFFFRVSPFVHVLSAGSCFVDLCAIYFARKFAKIYTDSHLDISLLLTIWNLGSTQCLKITKKVSFNIASEASYAYVLNVLSFLASFWIS